jgi:hypothetical protein
MISSCQFRCVNDISQNQQKINLFSNLGFCADGESGRRDDIPHKRLTNVLREKGTAPLYLDRPGLPRGNATSGLPSNASIFLTKPLSPQGLPFFVLSLNAFTSWSPLCSWYANAIQSVIEPMTGQAFETTGASFLPM